MTPWKHRAPEVARLLNPAFCAYLLRSSVRGYSEESTYGMPYALAFLVLPITLHRATREALPQTVASRLAFWISEHQQLRIGLADRVRALVPHTKEALIYALRDPFCEVNAARLHPVRRRLQLPPWPTDSEPQDCVDSARHVGRLLARAGSPAAVLTLLGLSV